MDIQWVGAHVNNFTKGRGRWKPQAIVIHIMDGTLAGTDAWFNSPAAHVSAHYGIGKAGEVHQYVNEEDTAYHAGIVVKPVWKGLVRLDAPHGGQYTTNPNPYTIGIEHEGKDDGEVWPDAQYQSSSQLIATLAKRWGIPLDSDHVIPHHWIRSDKTCPGQACDIQRLIDFAKNWAV